MELDEALRHVESVYNGIAYFGTPSAYDEWKEKTNHAIEMVEIALENTRRVVDFMSSLGPTMDENIRMIDDLLNDPKMIDDRNRYVRAALWDAKRTLEEARGEKIERVKRAIDTAIESLEIALDDGVKLPGRVSNKIAKILDSLEEMSGAIDMNYNAIEQIEEIGLDGFRQLDEYERILSGAKENYQRIVEEANEELRILEDIQRITWAPHFVQIKNIKESI